MNAIGDSPLDLSAISAALAGPIKVTLSEGARARIIRSAETVKRLLATGDAIYGVNTGFGKLAKTRIAMADLDRLQVNIVRSHAAGVGAPLSPGVTRLILLMKLNALSQGAAGAPRPGLRRRLGRPRTPVAHEPRAHRRGRGAGEGQAGERR